MCGDSVRFCRWPKICLMTAGSSIQAITITGCGAFAAGLNVYIKYPLAALCKGQRRASFCRCWPLLDYPGLVAPAPPGRRHPRPVPSVGRKHTVKAGQIDSGVLAPAPPGAKCNPAENGGPTQWGRVNTLQTQIVSILHQFTDIKVRKVFTS